MNGLYEEGRNHIETRRVETGAGRSRAQGCEGRQASHHNSIKSSAAFAGAKCTENKNEDVLGESVHSDNECQK